jgi:microcystin-dependent protein
MFGGNFAPAGWKYCEGQILPITEYETLFILIGTTYGGDGESTFGLPDMRGRLPIHFGNGFVLSETGGVEEVQLTTSQIPTHSHALLATTRFASQTDPQNAVPAAMNIAGSDLYLPNASGATLNPATLSSYGGSQPHTNMQPYLCVSFIISLFGIFPFNFAPQGWAFCDGQLLPLSQNTALFSLLGTTYGGDGKSNFALPNLQGCAPMHPGQGPGLSLHDLGETGGSDDVQLIGSEIPGHSHNVTASALAATSQTPSATVGLARSRGFAAYSTSTAGLVQLSPNAIGPVGNDLPHNNLMPYLTLNFCIALQGVFPPRS